MATFPFPQKKATEAAPAALAATTAAPAEAKPVKVKGLKKSGEPRKKPAPQMTPEQVKQILVLIKDNSYTQVATQLGITKYQVNRVLMQTKKSLREQAVKNPAKADRIEAYIKEYLSRPEDTLPGHGGGRGGKVKGAMDDVVGDILASIV